MKRVILIVFAGCLIGLPLAADTEKSSDIEVIVTASRVEEETTAVAAYVTVLTEEELSAAGQSTLVDSLQSLAGVHFRSTSGNAAQAEVSMRGFGENSHGRVLVLLDGRRLNRPDMASINWLEIPIENIERVEVVRGGSSVLYGDNAVAGVVNIITKQGSAGFDIGVSGQYGSYNSNQERVEVSGSTGALTLAVTGEHSATEGYRDRSAYESLAFGTNVRLELDTLSSSLALSYNKLFYQMPGELTEAQMAADPTQAINPADESNNQYLNADIGMSYGPSDRWLLDANLSYGLKFIQSDMVSYPSYTDLTLKTIAFTPKLKTELDLLAGNRLIVGIDCYYDRMTVDSYSDAGRTSTTSEYLLSKATAGAYLTDDLSLFESLTLSAGARYELIQIAAETLKTSGAPLDERELLQSLVYDVGLLFKPLPSAKLWLKHGTVYRYPFLDEIVDLYGWMPVAFNTDLEPERGIDIEIGIEAVLFDALRLAGNGFWLEMKDEIAYNSTTSLNENMEDTRHLGVEAEAAFTPFAWLELSGNYTYTASTFRAGANQGRTVPLAPEHQAEAGAVFRLPINLSAGISGRYVGEQYSGGDYDNSLNTLDDYWLLDLYVHYTPRFIPGKLDLYFGIENLLDQLYASSGYDYGTYVAYYPEAGRTWKVGGSYRY